MAEKKSYYMCGRGVKSLQEAYKETGVTLQELPESPADFNAGTRKDGLVTFRGPDNLWEAAGISMTEALAERVRQLPDVLDVCFIP